MILIAGANEVDEQDDMFILVAPQNAVGNCIIDVRSLDGTAQLCILRALCLYALHLAFNSQLKKFLCRI